MNYLIQLLVPSIFFAGAAYCSKKIITGEAKRSVRFYLVWMAYVAGFSTLLLAGTFLTGHPLPQLVSTFIYVITVVVPYIILFALSVIWLIAAVTEGNWKNSLLAIAAIAAVIISSWLSWTVQAGIRL